jgi:hypothetical protein
MAQRARKVPSVDAMNSFDRIPNEPKAYRPILRTGPTGDRPTDFDRCECTCPEVCQVDHDN